MKKQILGFALAAAIVGSITAGCSSQKSASGSDTTMKKDTTKMMAPAATDSMKKDSMKMKMMKDTMKKDTTHH